MSMGEITIKKYKNFEFVCWGWETSNAWGHECALCDTGDKAGMEVGHEKTRYYNRTWEVYTFQSVMFGALEDYKQRELEHFLNNYKYSNGLKGYDMEKHEEFEKPFPKGVKKKLIEEFNADPKWAELENYVKEGK